MTSRTFERHVGPLRDKLLEMSDLVGEALKKSMESIYTREEKTAREVIENDEAINALECEMDEINMKLVALDQPVAGDLRYILGSMRIIVDLERLGDEAVTIAERSLILQNRDEFEFSPLLKDLSELALSTYSEVIGALKNMDSKRALDLMENSSKAAKLSRKLTLAMTTIMINEARVVERAQQVSFISYNLRRVCERSINIAESIHFIETGGCLKHADKNRSRL